jgi:hypothetical protein
MELYERQLNFVESILAFHPEFMKIFSADEQDTFRTYFLPDWDKVKDFKEYHRQITTADPMIEARATALLRQFIIAHKVNHTQLLP